MLKLTSGQLTKVDDEDFEHLSQWKWNYNGNYATRHSGNGVIYLHRYIAGTPIGMSTDHINRNKLDNRRVNLRICDHSTNMFNREKTKRSTSGFKGVSWHKRRKKWQVYVSTKYIGTYRNLQDAVKARQDNEPKN